MPMIEYVIMLLDACMGMSASRYQQREQLPQDNSAAFVLRTLEACHWCEHGFAGAWSESILKVAGFHVSQSKYMVNTMDSQRGQDIKMLKRLEWAKDDPLNSTMVLYMTCFKVLRVLFPVETGRSVGHISVIDPDTV
jgi:hypothetical protein